MQSYLMKFGSTEECMDYLNYLRDLGSSRIMFAYRSIDTHFPIYESLNEDECTVEVLADFYGDPPEGFLDRVEVLPGFDPNNM